MDREQQDHQQAGEEGGQREADEGQRVRDLVEDRIGPGRRVDADRQRDAQRQDLRGADRRDRGRQPLQDQVVDIDAAGEGEAPLALSIVSQRSSAPWTGSLRPKLARRCSRTSGGTAGLVAISRERIARRQREHGEQDHADPSRLGIAISRRRMT
jgi:hypothetical protein